MTLASLLARHFAIRRLQRQIERCRGDRKWVQENIEYGIWRRERIDDRLLKLEAELFAIEPAEEITGRARA